MIYISNSFSWEVHSPSHCRGNEERTTPDFVGVVEPTTFALYDDLHLLYITALGATEPSIFPVYDDAQVYAERRALHKETLWHQLFCTSCQVWCLVHWQCLA